MCWRLLELIRAKYCQLRTPLTNLSPKIPIQHEVQTWIGLHGDEDTGGLSDEAITASPIARAALVLELNSKYSRAEPGAVGEVERSTVLRSDSNTDTPVFVAAIGYVVARSCWFSE